MYAEHRLLRNLRTTWRGGGVVKLINWNTMNKNFHHGRRVLILCLLDHEMRSNVSVTHWPSVDSPGYSHALSLTGVMAPMS